MTSSSALRISGGIFDVASKQEKLIGLKAQLENPDIWNDPKGAAELQKQIKSLEGTVNNIQGLTEKLSDLDELWGLAKSSDDLEMQQDVVASLSECQRDVNAAEFCRMFSGKHDSSNAFLEIQSGSGGTEAQDWADMLFRMYSRWAEKRGFRIEVLDYSPGEVAGIKGATLKLSGEFAYGWARTETGIHRLVRKSPFDSGNRRHTSFAAVFVTAEIDDDIEVDINTGDLRIDTYRSSGAGGQHVNTTDSAVRITHMPTNTVVQCQSERSQHQNKARAMAQLRSKLYEKQLMEKMQDQEALAKNKDEITWGRQIRSYVLDQSRVKDLRTGVETGNPQGVLDGDLDQFIEQSLKQGV